VTSWQTRGVCRDEDPELFFPTGASGPAAVQIEEAKAVCRRCPVMELCQDWALDTRQDSGIWGGLDEEERRRVHRRKTRAPMVERLGPRALADVLTERSTVTPDGHREWTATHPVTVSNTSYTPLQLAWWVAYGEAPQGEIRTQCGHPGCIEAEHLLDAAGRAEQHGKWAAWKAHRAAGESLCELCQGYQDKADEARRKRDRNRRRGKKQATTGCGTTKAYYQHVMTGEPVDPACQAASDGFEQQLTPPPGPPACGTRGGYQKHRRNGEPACDACRQANSDADRRLRNTGTTKRLAA
jgi:hypothetical protein